MSKKASYLIGAALLLAFGGFALSAFQESLTPYVSYDDARSSGRTVQVAGGLATGSSGYDDTNSNLFFTLVDEETQQTLPVRYNGIKPANFEDAVSIVAIGAYDAQGEIFAADKLLVKCPSKYQGLESSEGYETKEYG